MLSTIQFQGTHPELTPARIQLPRIINNPEDVSTMIWAATDSMDMQTELQYRIQSGHLSNDYERFTRNSIYLD